MPDSLRTLFVLLTGRSTVGLVAQQKERTYPSRARPKPSHSRYPLRSAHIHVSSMARPTAAPLFTRTEHARRRARQKARPRRREFSAAAAKVHRAPSLGLGVRPRRGVFAFGRRRAARVGVRSHARKRDAIRSTHTEPAKPTEREAEALPHPPPPSRQVRPIQSRIVAGLANGFPGCLSSAACRR